MHNKNWLWSLVLCPLLAQADHLEEVYVPGQRGAGVELAKSLQAAADSASLVARAPGARVNGNGPLTGIPQIRGSYGPRVHTRVDGADIAPGGPNWMDPPLSYAPAPQLESLTIYRGIAPVSAGQETLGGAVVARTWQGQWASGNEAELHGRLRLSGATADQSTSGFAGASLANQHHRVFAGGLDQRADDLEFADGDVLPTEYERNRWDAGYGYRRGAHQWTVSAARSNTGDTGTPALPMDIAWIDTDLLRTEYHFDGGDWQLQARWFRSDVEHGMTNYHLRQAPAPGNWRRNIATGDSQGGGLSLSWQQGEARWQVGVDYLDAAHDARIDNPNNPMFFVDNFNDIERTVLGLFIERNQPLSEDWQLELGLRGNRVETDAGQVDGTPARMMMAGAMLRDRFNNADRSQRDDTLDWVARLWWQGAEHWRWTAALARKTRTPSYQERYLWLPLEATAGLADGRNYIGDPSLDPEVAHEFELGFDWQGEHAYLSPRLFYRVVDDFIQGVPSTDGAAQMFAMMMGQSAPLQFANVDAVQYGLDLEWRYRLTAVWHLEGVVNLLRGKRDDAGDDLYRQAPQNARIAVVWSRDTWQASLESELVAKQTRVADFNDEQETAGYGLLHARASWQVQPQLVLTLDLENLLDRDYRDHLSGYNRAVNADLAIGERLPGAGRNARLGLTWQW